MSYVKDLMAVAADWVKWNPTTASGQIKIPRTPLRREDRSYMDRYDRALAAIKDPIKAEAMRSALDQLRDQHVELDAAQAKVREIEDVAEYRINQIDVNRQNKYTLDDVSKNTGLHGRWCLAWAHAGYNVFELSNDFVAAMLLTDPRAIRFDELRAPFPGVLVTFPTAFVSGAEGLPYTKAHLSYVDGSWGLYATDGVHVLDTRVAEGQALSWNFLESLEAEEAETKIEEADFIAIRSIRQIVFGMLAYVTAVDRAIEERLVQGKGKRRSVDEGPRSRVHDVGRSVKIDPILVKCARSGAREIALQLKCRFIVRGHYRNQAHGPALRDRKTIWIEPYFKGPEDGAKIIHTYKPTTQPPSADADEVGKSEASS